MCCSYSEAQISKALAKEEKDKGGETLDTPPFARMINV